MYIYVYANLTQKECYITSSSQTISYNKKECINHFFYLPSMKDSNYVYLHQFLKISPVLDIMQALHTDLFSIKHYQIQRQKNICIWDTDFIPIFS